MMIVISRHVHNEDKIKHILTSATKRVINSIKDIDVHNVNGYDVSNFGLVYDENIYCFNENVDSVVLVWKKVREELKNILVEKGYEILRFSDIKIIDSFRPEYDHVVQQSIRFIEKEKNDGKIQK